MNTTLTGPRPTPAARPAAVPRVSPRFVGWFTWYSRRYIARHFNSLRVSRVELPKDLPPLPLVVYANHPSWWDPLVCLVLKEHFFPRHTAFTPMEAAALRRYPMFGRMGFFGVERGTRRGASQFLRTSSAILESPDHILALTPQGRFADVRERPVTLEPGLGHLAKRVEEAVFLPVALEYTHWEERLPEILVRFGTPVRLARRETCAFDAELWTDLFRERLESAQDALAEDSRQRSTERFLTLLSGRAGQGGVYDLWRRVRSWARGKPFEPRHGNR